MVQDESQPIDFEATVIEKLRDFTGMLEYLVPVNRAWVFSQLREDYCLQCGYQKTYRNEPCTCQRDE